MPRFKSALLFQLKNSTVYFANIIPAGLPPAATCIFSYLSAVYAI